MLATWSVFFLERKSGIFIRGDMNKEKRMSGDKVQGEPTFCCISFLFIETLFLYSGEHSESVSSIFISEWCDSFCFLFLLHVSATCTSHTRRGPFLTNWTSIPSLHHSRCLLSVLLQYFQRKPRRPLQDKPIGPIIISSCANRRALFPALTHQHLSPAHPPRSVSSIIPRETRHPGFQS